MGVSRKQYGILKNMGYEDDAIAKMSQEDVTRIFESGNSAKNNNVRSGNAKAKTQAELWGVEHKGVKGGMAIEKLLSEKQGHIKGALSRSEVGDIDLVWGDDSAGLQHIIKRRERMLADGRGSISGFDMVRKIPEIVEKGSFVYNKKTGRINIEHEGFLVSVGLTYDNVKITWLVTSMEILI